MRFVVESRNSSTIISVGTVLCDRRFFVKALERFLIIRKGKRWSFQECLDLAQAWIDVSEDNKQQQHWWSGNCQAQKEEVLFCKIANILKEKAHDLMAHAMKGH